MTTTTATATMTAMDSNGNSRLKITSSSENTLFKLHFPTYVEPKSLTSPPLLALGMLQWGTTPFDDKIIGGSRGMLSETEAREIYQTFRSRGVVIFDTAEGYGGGTSEKRLGRLLHGKQKTKSDNTSSTETPLNIQGDKILMTKFLPVPWRFTHKHFENALRASNMRMGVTECPIYLLHSPMHISRDIEYWVESAAICKRKGLLKYFGLSNCSSHQVKRAVDAGKKVVVNQVHYSLLDYDSDALKKMQKTCDELGVAIIAYNSLGQGLLCDNLTREKFAHNKPAKMMGIQWDDLVPLRTALREIADAHGTKKDGADEANARVSMAQVALCWCRAHNTIPLVGCRSKKQAEDSLSSLTFDLTSDEVSALDALALNRCTLDSPGWRRKLFVALAGVVMTACRWMDWSPASPIAGE